MGETFRHPRWKESLAACTVVNSIIIIQSGENKIKRKDYSTMIAKDAQHNTCQRKEKKRKDKRRSIID